MNKRTFLKTSIALATGSLMKPLITPLMSDAPEARKNWAGNIQYSTDNLHQPKTVEEVQQIVKKSQKLRGLGTRHCFNHIADSTSAQLSVRAMDKVVSIDKQAQTVTVEGGISYGQLCPYLNEHGFALHNLASLPHISVAGAAATATHGSGVKNGNLSTAVRAIEFVNANGDLVTLSRDKDGDQFQGAVVSLGALGIVTRITLDVQPAYMVKQVVYRNMPLKELTANFQAIESSGYSVSLFTDWTRENINQVWIKSRVDTEQSRISSAPSQSAPPEFFGAKAATRNMHPIDALSAENCTEQMGVPGPWYERLPHFRMGFTPSAGQELQSEYFVPAEHAVEAILAVFKIGPAITPHLFITEIRTIAADTLWMSPCYKQDRVAIHFTWKPEWDAVKQLLPRIEQTLAPFGARPHWGKLFTMPPEHLQPLIQRLPDFRALLKHYDPAGKFRNEFIDMNVG
jgi:alditol oxidase